MVWICGWGKAGHNGAQKIDVRLVKIEIFISFSQFNQWENVLICLPFFAVLRRNSLDDSDQGIVP